MKKFWIILLTLMAGAFVTGCVTQKKKGQETGWLKRGYHSLTSKYNYWFNADELFRLTTTRLEEQHQDNYSQLLDLYPYMATDPQPAKGDLDNVVKKASSGIALHRVGDWSDDNYTLIGQAQYVKQDFETAESTFRWIKDEYDPNRKTKKNKAALAKNKKKIAKEKKKIVEEKKKKKEDTAKKKKKVLEEKRKAAAKKKKVAAKNKKKAKKSKAKGKSKGKTAAKTPKPVTTTPPPTTAPAKAPETPAVAETPAPAPEEAVLLGNSPYKKGLRRQSAYPLAMVWFVRTLTAREKYEEAEFVLRDLYEDRFFPTNLQDDLAVAEADLWIKQKKYDQALKPLAKAVELTTKKKDRARYAFILAQLYDRAGQYEKAFATYETVLSSAPAYEMEFNARLHQVQAGWSNGQMSSAEANRSLEKMAKDEKNLDYQDQIYYTLAEIALKDGLKKDAIAYLRKSLDTSKGNAAQRAESYLKLADLYFEAEDFVHAKNYYDSTVTVLVTTDPRYKRAMDYAANLTDIARLLTTVAANDSIMRVYRMSDAERKDLAKEIRKQQQKEAEAQAAAARIAAAAAKVTTPAKGITPVAGQKASSFYFYNESYVKKGKKDFTKVWGDRRLEDNWRRSNRAQPNSNEEVATTDSSGNNTVSDTELGSIFQSLPKNDAELAVINASNYEALYTLGTLFRDKLQNYKRSAASLEEEQARYPTMEKFEKETWYYAFLDYTDLNNPPKAKYYYDKLTGKYPSSLYARALSDPNFLASGKNREKELSTYYDSTFTYFQIGQYQLAYDRCTSAPQKYGSQNPLMAKFSLLSALCIGNLRGNEAYCQALSEVIARYPESAESTRAKEIARLLGCKGFEVLEPAKNKVEIDDSFTREDDKLHYFIVALTGNDIRLDDVKGAVSDYNREFHKTEQLRISNIFLGTNTDAPIIVIRKFDNKEQVMRFYQEVKGRKGFLGETDKKTYNKEYFAITQENYRRVLKNKTLDGYRTFFETNYLK